MLEGVKTLFFISITRRVTLNPHQHGSETKFRQEFLGRLFAKRRGTRFLRQLIPQFSLESRNFVGRHGFKGFARCVAGDGVAHNLLWAYAL